MLSFVAYAYRWLRWLVAWPFRLRRPPAWIAFTLEGAYPDYPRPAPNLLLRLVQPQRASLFELREQFREVAHDRRVEGVVLHLRPLQLAGSQVDSLRDAITELRRAGKRVVAWSYHWSRANYLVACAADEVLLQPGGSVDALAIGATHVFLAEALARIGVRADVIPISGYKSALEMFTSNALSDESREMENWLLDAAASETVAAIARGRHVDEDAARALIDATPCTDERARELGLVDAVVSGEDLPAHLGSPGTPAEVEPFDTARGRLRQAAPSVPRRRRVALIPIEGTIVDGDSGRPPVAPPVPVPVLFSPRAGDVTVVQAIREAARDPGVGAVVVYVNSPGGSATASEAIHAALQRLNAEKPVVVAMGPVAASGGYYVATPARRVYAQPRTITGSIGVVTAKFVAGDLLDRLSVHRESLRRGRHALLGSAERPFSDEERALVWAQVQRIYALFVDRVAADRRMSAEAVDAVARGRVWTGRQARERGLVDAFGGLWEAVERAKALARLPDDAPMRVATPGRATLAPAAAAPLPAALRALLGGALGADVSVAAYALEGIAALSGGTPLTLSSVFARDLR